MDRRSLCLGSLSLVATGPALAHHDVKLGKITIIHTWSRATPGGARVGGGYMRIRNDGTVADRLVGGTMEAAGRVEIHEMAVVDGIMRMRELANGLEIPALGSVELRPGGFHIMFLDLTRPLRQGEKLKGTLLFANAGVASVEYEVGALGAGPDGHTHRH
ncbi:copper chaperone PCu(A)C [Phreatobacter sp.]|uniref:copper chaperone PCu(A)C n=1 Tax=Phreatobacter sp. TaxID=1966341 RepID=UPI0025FEFC85|nr:copper chaperone PCu(A)C [Phreatobacter sp.]